MRLLFVIDCLGSGGAQRQMVNLALGLAQHGHNIELFVYYPEKDHFSPLLEKAGITIHVSKKTSRFSLSVISALRNLIRRGDYDLVLSFLATPNIYNILAGKFLYCNPAIIVSERSYNLDNTSPWLERLARFFYRFADHIVVNSHHQYKHLSQKYPYLRGKLTTIYNGYDLVLFAPKKTPKIVSNSNLQILVIASISPGKNGLCLVRALNVLRQSFRMLPTVSWVGAQEISGERLSYRQEMDREIAEYDLSDQWRWLGQRTDIIALLNKHDLLVHPSFGEGLPNVVCEALACARPVIVSDTLDHPCLVQDGVSGFLFDWRSPKHLATCIKRFSELTSDMRNEMGRQGRLFAERELSMGKLVCNYEDLFSQTIQNKG
jgi:GalNAc-alpha-(1->4)-GalNAc-alpha-(1->3)-diNAcBac-PP-undecaprenol alpha-1,4-N-acetyl-D-galactosaminyltransferase